MYISIIMKDLYSKLLTDETGVLFFMNIVSSCFLCIILSVQSPHTPVGLWSFARSVTHCFSCSYGSAAAPGDKPAPHRQLGPLQWQGVRERDGTGQSCDRDVEQDSASSSRGIRSHGQGTRGTRSSIAFKFFTVSQSLLQFSADTLFELDDTVQIFRSVNNLWFIC